jgi:hypothetical protein
VPPVSPHEEREREKQPFDVDALDVVSSQMTLMVSSSAASFHSDAEAAAADVAAAAVPFSVAVAHVFAAVVASVADGAVPTAVFLCHQSFAVPPVDVPGLAFVGASAAPALASGTSFLVPVDISGRSLDFRC